MRIAGRISALILFALLLVPFHFITAAQSQHSITVAWTFTQGADAAIGFNVYRGTTTGGPYVALNTTPLPLTTLTYSDAAGVAGTKYFYVITSIDAQGFESGYSTEASAIFLSNPAVPSGVTATAK